MCSKLEREHRRYLIGSRGVRAERDREWTVLIHLLIDESGRVGPRRVAVFKPPVPTGDVSYGSK